jgi:hypothetical protein
VTGAVSSCRYGPYAGHAIDAACAGLWARGLCQGLSSIQHQPRDESNDCFSVAGIIDGQPRRGTVKCGDDRSTSVKPIPGYLAGWLVGRPMSSTARVVYAVQLTGHSLTKGKPSGDNAAPAPHRMAYVDRCISIVLGTDKVTSASQRLSIAASKVLPGRNI